MGWMLPTHIEESNLLYTVHQFICWPLWPSQMDPEIIFTSYLGITQLNHGDRKKLATTNIWLFLMFLVFQPCCFQINQAHSLQCLWICCFLCLEHTSHRYTPCYLTSFRLSSNDLLLKRAVFTALYWRGILLPSLFPLFLFNLSLPDPYLNVGSLSGGTLFILFTMLKIILTFVETCKDYIQDSCSPFMVGWRSAAAAPHDLILTEVDGSAQGNCQFVVDNIKGCGSGEGRLGFLDELA